MQGKVSMVVPCYNKARYIGSMLDSVIAQVWDNIELILVNDGSDDGTREVIAAYEQKIRARGYELKIVDQENRGCCAAVYAGMLKMNGDYFCLVDSDDALEPEYVSLMAEWLEEYGDYEWAICSYRPYLVRDGKVEAMPVVSSVNMTDNVQLLERHILRKIITTSWVYMTRVSYIKKCRLLDNFCVERRKTYEPLFAVPLMLGGGKLKCFSQPLYRFNRFASDMYAFDVYEKVDTYYTDYAYLYKWSIERADISLNEKKKLYALVKLGNIKDCLYHLNDMDSVVRHVCNNEIFIDAVAEKASALIDELFEPKPCLLPRAFKSKRYTRVIDLFSDIALRGGNASRISVIEGSRFIAYGVLGRVANVLLPPFMGTRMEPELYWDMAADDDTAVFGRRVTQPRFDQLKKGDAILVFPKSAEIAQYVQENCREAKVIEVAMDSEALALSSVFGNPACYQFVF